MKNHRSILNNWKNRVKLNSNSTVAYALHWWMVHDTNPSLQQCRTVLAPEDTKLHRFPLAPWEDKPRGL